MLCGTSVQDENLIVTGITDYVRYGNSLSVYVYVFLSVLKAEKVWIWDESCLVCLNHYYYIKLLYHYYIKSLAGESLFLFLE